jgi:phage tail sheath gpL-like
MSINVPGFSPGWLVPGVFGFALFAGGVAGGGARQRAHVHLGNRIASAITGSAPTLSVAAATRAANTLTRVLSDEESAAYFGRGSELHRMAIRHFRQHPGGVLYQIAIPESSGGSVAKARGTVTFVGACEGNATFRLYIAGRTIDLPISGTPAASVAIATMAEDLCDVVNAIDDLPVTAQFSSGVCTITAKHNGARGNQIEFAAEWVTDTSRVTVSSTAVAPGNGVATTAALSTNTGALGSGVDGSTAEDISTALALLEARAWRIALSMNDDVTLAALDTWLTAQAAVSVQNRHQAVACTRGTLGDSSTDATDRNNERLQLAWHYRSPVPCDEVAAQILAGRSIGDAIAGGTTLGEENDPNTNLDGLILRDVIPQRDEGDRPTLNEMQTGLAAGLAPLVASGVQPGACELLSSVTTRTRGVSSGSTSYAVHQTSVVTSVDHCTDTLRADFQTEFRGYRIVADDVEITADRTTSPSRVRAWTYAKLRGFEQDAILRNVEANEDSLAIEEDTGMAGRLLGEIPMQCVPGLRQFAFVARQRA